MEHALFIAHNHVRRTKIQQALEPVIAVDNAPVEIVQVRGGKAAAIELHHRAQVGRNYGQHGQDHPLRLVAGTAQRLNHLDALGGLLLLLLALGGAHLMPQLFGQLVQVKRGEDVAERLSTHAGLENLSPLLLQLTVFWLRQKHQLMHALQFIPVCRHALALLVHQLVELALL